MKNKCDANKNIQEFHNSFGENLFTNKTNVFNKPCKGTIVL
jgi:hypothetical protein